MKKTNKLISILLAVAMIMSLVPMNLSVSAAPDTDYNGYYKITNAGNLAWFACLVVGDTSQSGITEAEPDAKAVLTADIDITILAKPLGKSWVGIGTTEIPFTGIFDGNGYTIKGLTTDTNLTKSAVATVAVDTEKQGLFGVIGEGGVVRDVVVEGTATLSDTIKYGGICSENNGTIENVLSMVTVTGGNNADVLCHTNNGTITNSFTNQTTSVASGVTTVDAAALADGSVTYALGASFGQTIGTDLQPVHFNGENTVYKAGDTYTNIEPEYVASVTDADGNEIEGSPYLTFADAATAALANKNSTLKLLDNADGCYVRVSSPFTLNLNGYTLDMGDENFDIGSVLDGKECHLTVTDTSEAETGKIVSADPSHAFYVGYSASPGKLTVLNGTVEYNYENGAAIRLSDKGVVEIKGGTFMNSASPEIYINNWRNNFEGSIDISGGTFPEGLDMKVYSSNYTSTENFLADLLADGCFYRDEKGNIVEVAEDATVIDTYVKVVKGANLSIEADVTLRETEFEFTGEEITPEILVTVNGKAVESKDFFDITYENNVNAGTATVTISGKEDSDFTGSVTLGFTILPKKVEVIWSASVGSEDNITTVQACYYDVNDEVIVLDVENGVNSEPGVYIASAVIEDANYVAENLTYKYIVYGDKSLSGTVTSFNSETDEVTLLLYKEGDRENAYEVTVTGTSAEYVFARIGEGTYILEVSKNNHVTRTYEVTVDGEEDVQDAKIHLKGDINGDGRVNTIDVSRANAHAKGRSPLSGYELACCDVTGDGKVNTIDVAKINSHAKGVVALW